MILYNQNDKGLSLTAMQVENLQLTNSDIRGFFRNEDLQRLLDIPGCVGIRFYNIIPPNATPHLVASAAKADGFEFENLYLINHDILGDDCDQPAIERTNKADARTITDATPTSTQFMSFYGKDELEQDLLVGPHDGLSFFQTSLTTVEDTNLSAHQQDHLIPIKSETSTHLAVPTSLVAGRLPVMISNTFGNKLSIHPCPGHCLKSTNSGGTSTTERGRFPDAANAVTTSDPYLFRWHEWTTT